MDTTNLPKTRAEAKATGAPYYFTGEPCKHGHTAPRKTKGACVECLRVEWQQASKTRAEYFRNYNQREAVKDKKHDWYVAHHEEVKQAAAARPAHVKREYQNAWKTRNVVWVRADTKARRRKHREATPKWLTRKQKAEIRQLYQAAITNSKITGEQYVVDHIYPLRSEVVCGLHVPWNLRIITQNENLEKSNTLPDDSMALAFPPKP
jgi:5-methylcytosine-specific restriction endonuclease McrA